MNIIRTFGTSRVAKSVVPLYRRYEPSKDLVSQSLSSKREREMAHKVLSHSSERVREGEMDGSRDSWPLAHSSESAQERDRLTRLLTSCQMDWAASDLNQTVLATVLACFNSVKHCFSML